MYRFFLPWQVILKLRLNFFRSPFSDLISFVYSVFISPLRKFHVKYTYNLYHMNIHQMFNKEFKIYNRKSVPIFSKIFRVKMTYI